MRRRPPIRHHEAGFTLIEALLATALMVAILTALATIAAQWIPNWNRGFARVQRSESLALGMDRLVADLSSAEYVPVVGDRGALVFEGSELAVMFVRTATGPNALGLEIVRIAETSGGRGFTLVRTTAPFAPTDRDSLDSLRPNFGNPVVLVRSPYRISFAYAGPDRQWRRTWRGGQMLPAAIRVVVRDAGSSRQLAFSTVVNLRVRAPAFCIRDEKPVACINRLLKPPNDAETFEGRGERRTF